MLSDLNDFESLASSELSKCSLRSALGTQTTHVSPERLDFEGLRVKINVNGLHTSTNPVPKHAKSAIFGFVPLDKQSCLY